MSIELVPHDPAWRSAFEAEAYALRHVMFSALENLHHIGSTAISGIVAKPVIDMLGVATSLDAVDTLTPALQTLGYVAKGENGIPGRRYFQKSTPLTGVRSHHLHIYANGDAHIERHLAFRDYLRAHPERAAEYSALKTNILLGAPGSRAAYQDTKSPFILKTETAALEWFRQAAKPTRSDKACPVILRRQNDIIEILAFRHPTAGLQFVKGSIEPGEAPETAARRELKEESGIALSTPMTFIGVSRLGEQQRQWHFYMTEISGMPDQWRHQTEDDHGHIFAFFWHPLYDDLDDQWHPLFHEMYHIIRKYRRHRS
ncbi:GrpB family protein [Asticcacaulis sp. BYS171W]|uniref:GrpB family protein n=1 Tax=Asticcacaulis aquaticus TaxID=2984212 RepID=A0ABT5HXR5_9CAUL|nr:GrpB family protein [Asticcacaulis aquaticus]MDC7684246.1 GrpB family protein [Asticcacaulis aquaticus]